MGSTNFMLRILSCGESYECQVLEQPQLSSIRVETCFLKQFVCLSHIVVSCSLLWRFLIVGFLAENYSEMGIMAASNGTPGVPICTRVDFWALSCVFLPSF